MNTLILLLIIAAIFIFILEAFKGRGKPSQFPYVATSCLMSPAEWAFFGVLMQAVGQSGVVFAKVRVADAMTPRKGLDRSKWQSAFNIISAKHFDFLVCSPTDSTILAAFELDDASHGSKTRQKRDEFLEGACEASGLPLIRVKAAKSYVMPDIRQQFEDVLERNNDRRPAQHPVQASVSRKISTGSSSVADLKQASVQAPKVNNVAKNSSQDQAAPSCPKCFAPMVRRTARSGPNARRQFWGCSTYPSCRGII